MPDLPPIKPESHYRWEDQLALGLWAAVAAVHYLQNNLQLKTKQPQDLSLGLGQSS